MYFILYVSNLNKISENVIPMNIDMILRASRKINVPKTPSWSKV